MNLDKLLAAMGRMNASDLFVCGGKIPSVRVKGAVRRLDLPATSSQSIMDFLRRVLTPHQMERFETTGDLDAGYTPAAGGGRYRINVHRQQGQPAIVARALPTGKQNFAELNLPEAIANLADLRDGLVLVTGATGSGKSTTLASMVQHINATRHAHIVTIEDPIEFVYHEQKSRITQREVGADTVDFHSALRHVLRESPDVILIGEMRDMESMTVAVSAALTGHLVLATLHTIDTVQSLQRIMGFYPEHLRDQACLDLSLCLRGIVSQRLIPRKDGAGRLPATELLTSGPAVSRLIREQRLEDIADWMRTQDTPDVVTFNASLVQLHKKGLITPEVGIAYASNPDQFRLSIQGLDVGIDAFRGDGRGGGIQDYDMKTLLALCVKHGASDLHLSEGRPPIYRISGALHRLPGRELGGPDIRSLLYSILSGRQRSVFELDKELDFSLSLEDGHRFRVNAYWQKGHMSVSLRTIPIRIPDAKELGLPEVVIGFADKPHGLVLVVGPTGSGKTTTLACLIDRVNRTRPCKIVTVEDPIEYSHKSIKATVDQREVYADTNSFSAALKYILRQDPDVIMVGEMRDLETIQAALTAAETGHLVFATLHTNDAAQTMDRIVDVFPPHQQTQIRTQLSSSLVAVVSQRLLPRADGSGRVAAFEIMIGTPAVRNIVRDGKTHQIHSILETQMREGMVTMDRSMAALYRQGLITYEDAARFVLQPTVLGPAPPGYGR